MLVVAPRGENTFHQQTTKSAAFRMKVDEGYSSWRYHPQIPNQASIFRLKASSSADRHLHAQ